MITTFPKRDRYEVLMRLCKAQLPKEICDAGPARGTIVTGNENIVCFCLGNATRDDSDADFGYELDGRLMLRGWGT
jgi:hypothetical protein